MQTSALITLIQRQAADWTSEEIRELINDVQFWMMSKPLAFNRAIDSSTGKDQYLPTTTDTYRYTIDTSNGFDSDALFIESVYPVSSPPKEPAYNLSVSNGTDVTTTIGTISGAATVTFCNNPGTTTTTYYVRYYKKPTEVSTQQTNLTIPEAWHIPGVRAGVLAIIESVEHGANGPKWNDFTENVLPNFWGDMSMSADNIGRLVQGGGY